MGQQTNKTNPLRSRTPLMDANGTKPIPSQLGPYQKLPPYQKSRRSMLMPMKGEQWLNKSIQTQTLESFAGGLARP